VTGSVTAEPAVPPPTLVEDGLLHLVADAYRAAALDGANMRRAAEALEAIRSAAPPDAYFDIWAAIDKQIGLADEAALQRTLNDLRADYAKAAIDHELTNRKRALTKDPDEGWRDWLRAFADALDHWRWQLLFALAKAPLPFPSGVSDDVEQIGNWTRLAFHDRWPEANGLLLYFGALDFLPNPLRGSITAYAAQVQLYHLFLPEEALPLLEQAEALAPDAPMVKLGRADYALQRGDYEQTRERCRQIIDAHPDFVDAHNLIGQAYDRENDLESAEHWFNEAVGRDPGFSTGYVNLLRLYGRPELLDTHESRLPSLVDRAIAVDPDGEYSVYVAMGLVHQQNARYPEAHGWFDRAVALASDRDDAYVQKGYAYFDESRFADSEDAFRKAVDAAPGAFNGPWGLAGLYEAQERWTEALELLRESLSRRPEWRAAILSRTGAILLSLERYEEAEAELLESLRLDPANDSTASSLESLVTACFERPERTEASFRLLDAVREILGSAYEPTYRNLIGHLHYYFGHHDEAIAAYAQAAELQPDEPIYHSNLALAWGSRRRPGERSEELTHAIASEQRARDLNPEDAEYRDTLGALLAEEAVLRLCGESALALEWPPPLRVDVSRSLLPAILDAQLVDVSEEVVGLIDDMRAEIKATTGILVPGIRFRELDSDDGSYVIALGGTSLPTETVQLDKLFCRPPLDRLRQLDISAEVYRQSLSGAWIAEGDRGEVESAGIVLWTPVQYMLGHLDSILRARLEYFVDHRQVSLLLDEAGVGADVRATPALLTDFVVALRTMVREGVPIVAFGAIATAFSALAGEGLDRLDVVARLRALPEVASSLPGNDEGSELHPLDPAVEQELESAVVRDGAPPVLALSRRDGPAELRTLQARQRDGKRIAVVVANPQLRPFVSALLESVPDTCVISRDELTPSRQEALAEVGAA
jgi:tetratricopeptide (TPR) repeat protein